MNEKAHFKRKSTVGDINAFRDKNGIQLLQCHLFHFRIVKLRDKSSDLSLKISTQIISRSVKNLLYTEIHRFSIPSIYQFINEIIRTVC